MNKAQIAEAWDIPANQEKAEEQLRDLLQRAQASGFMCPSPVRAIAWVARRSIPEAS